MMIRYSIYKTLKFTFLALHALLFPVIFLAMFDDKWAAFIPSGYSLLYLFLLFGSSRFNSFILETHKKLLFKYVISKKADDLFKNKIEAHNSINVYFYPVMNLIAVFIFAFLTILVY